MKLNVSYPITGAQKTFEVVDDHKLRLFYEKRMGAEVDVEPLGDEWKGYILRIAGGNDKQGFPMKQGVLTNTRVRLLLKKGHSCYRPRRTGERKRKSVRGCIVDQNLSALALIVVKKGEKEIEGLTDINVPRRLGPKRANHIRKLFNLSKEDDVRKYVIKRPLVPKEGKESKKPRFQAPRIQRLITPITLQRKRHRLALKKRRVESRKEAEAEYAKLLAQRRRDEKLRRRTRSASIRESKSSISSDKDVKKPEVKKVEPAKAAVKKVEPKKADAKKGDAKKAAEPKKTDAKKAEPKKADAKKADAKKPEPAKKTDAKKAPEPAKKAAPAPAPAKKAAPAPEKKVEAKKAPEPAKKAAPAPAKKPAPSKPSSGDAKKPKKK